MQGSGQVCSGSRSCSPRPQHHGHRDSFPREEREGSPEDGGNRVSPQVVALFSAEIPTENTGPCSERSKCVHFSENCDLESQFLSLLPHPADAGVKEFFCRVGEAARIAVRLFLSHLASRPLSQGSPPEGLVWPVQAKNNPAFFPFQNFPNF